MLVENAEHFGLAQLHQLRGRVGRGKARHCVLLTGPALSKEGRQRLRVMQDSTDGFYVAEQDLQIRGPGELLGTKQSGLPELRVGNILHHTTCLEQARRAAFELLKEDPSLTQPEHQALAAAAQVRWGGGWSWRRLAERGYACLSLPTGTRRHCWTLLDGACKSTYICAREATIPGNPSLLHDAELGASGCRV